MKIYNINVKKVKNLPRANLHMFSDISFEKLVARNILGIFKSKRDKRHRRKYCRWISLNVSANIFQTMKLWA